MQKTMGFCQTMVHRETEKSVHWVTITTSKLFQNWIIIYFFISLPNCIIHIQILTYLKWLWVQALFLFRADLCKILLHSILHLILFTGNEFSYWCISFICHKCLHYKPRIKFGMDRDQCDEETKITQQKRC